MITAIVFFLVLSVLVLIHELGHFFVAKRSKMLVEEFGFGLPPRLFGIRFGETLYSVNLLPFGGFVKIFGENPEDLKKKPQEKARAFSAKPWWQRALVIVAGPTMNFLLAVAVISYMFTRGTYLPAEKVTVVKVEASSPAQSAGLKKNDILATFAGHKLTKTTQLIELSHQYAGQTVTIKFERAGRFQKTSLKPRRNPPVGQGALGLLITDLELKRYPFYQAPFVGLWESLKISAVFYQELGKLLAKLVTLQRPAIEVTGPIGIAQLTNQAVNHGADAVLQLLGLLSLNLALINIIPFPALDGGQLSFVIYEAIARKKLNEELKAKINAAGFAVLLFLLALVTLKDLKNLF